MNISDKPLKNIIVLVSGGGTNLQALIDAQNNGQIIGGKISCVISSNPNAYALVRAKENGIPTRIIPRKSYKDNKSYSEAVLEALYEEYADLIVLAAYPYKIINVHPALIPSFCGQGFYGLKVHEEALKYGVKISGATVHFVNEIADAGAIIMQKAVAVKNDDTPEKLQKRIMQEAEWKILPETVSLFCQDRIEINNGKAYIKED